MSYGNGTRVPKGTPGAIEQQIESAKWYGCWKDGKNKVMVPPATDKQASQAMLTDIIRHRERGEAGLVNPYKPYLDRAVEEHMVEYLAALREEGRTPFYMHEKERIPSETGPATSFRPPIRIPTLTLTPMAVFVPLTFIDGIRGCSSGRSP